MDIYERYGDYHGYARTEIELGEIYLIMRKFDEAEYYLIDALERFQKVGDKNRRSWCLFFLGELFKDKGDIEAAKICFKEASKIYTEIGDASKVELVKVYLESLE